MPECSFFWVERGEEHKNFKTRGQAGPLTSTVDSAGTCKSFSFKKCFSFIWSLLFVFLGVNCQFCVDCTKLVVSVCLYPGLDSIPSGVVFS